MIFRLRCIQRGGHVHCRLFQAEGKNRTWQKNGDLVFDARGWLAFSAIMRDRLDIVLEDQEYATIVDCDCRNPRCGHKASMHVGADGRCIVDGCACGPGGWT